jgi:hypothetical protein
LLNHQEWTELCFICDGIVAAPSRARDMISLTLQEEGLSHNLRTMLLELSHAIDARDGCDYVVDDIIECFKGSGKDVPLVVALKRAQHNRR